MDKNTDIGAINSKEQLETILRYIQIGKKEGSAIYQTSCSLPKKGFWCPPTLFTDVAQSNRIAQEEIFGPVLPVYAFDSINTVVAEINAREKPLALYIFDKDASRVAEITRRTTSGAVGVNLTLVHYSHLNLPFGGVNSSGIGAAHGHAGFLAFSHERAVLRNRFLLLPLLFPPYTPRVMRLIGLVKRFLG